MNNKKCPYCGFINFLNAETCRKCETVLTGDPSQQSSYEYAPTYRGGVNSYQQPYQAKRDFSVLKAVVYVFVGLVVFGTISGWGLGYLRGGGKVKWIEYHPDGLEMTIMMPNEPTRIEPVVTPTATGNMSNHSYASIVPRQGTALFCFVDYSGIFIDNEVAGRALDAELNAFLTRTKATLISKRTISYEGMTGLEFEITPPSEIGSTGQRSYGKMFVSPSRLYFLSITAGENTDLLAGKDNFLNPKINGDGPRPARLDYKIPPINVIKN